MVVQNDHHFIRVRGSVGHLFGKGKQGNLSLLRGLRDIDWKVGDDQLLGLESQRVHKPVGFGTSASY